MRARKIKRSAMIQQKCSYQRNYGFTLLELIVTMGIMGILISVAVPNMGTFFDTQRLIGATEQVYGHLQQARSESVSSNNLVGANFSVNNTTTWAYGISSQNDLCTVSIIVPTTANACVIVVDDGDGIVNATDLVLMRFSSDDYPGIIMNIANFSSTNTQILFNPTRGTSTSGQVLLTNPAGDSLRVNSSLLGRVSICSPGGSIDNYLAC
jgi:type IV fimbrial biogenesis protein FimT